MNPSNAALLGLVDEPREALDIEIKEWLDLGSNEHRAALAKEIMGLANHGGGFLVIGFKERNDGSFIPDAARPEDLVDWSQDAIQSVVSKYLDPVIQCSVSHVQRSGTTNCFPVISVPGGERVPIRARAGAPDAKKLVANRIYIRRAGPATEEPQSADEWDGLLGRILQNRKTELLDAMRSILAGVVPGKAQ